MRQSRGGRILAWRRSIGLPAHSAYPTATRRRAGHREYRSRSRRLAAPKDLRAALLHDLPPLATVLIPAYNERHGLPPMLVRLRPLLDETYEVLVVDDGSTDGTATVAATLGARVISHTVNRGKAAAVRTGVAEARGLHIIVIDADDTYPVEDIPRVAEALKSTDFVIGVRRGGREYISPFNRLGNHFFGVLIGAFAGRRLADPLSGLYGLRRDSLQQMELASPGFGIEAEIAIKAGRWGLSMLELPVDYRPRIGISKLSPIRDGILILKTALVHARWRSPGPPARTLDASADRHPGVS